MDLLHCESQAFRAVEEGKGSLQNVQGELITQAYFDSVAAEVNELLQVRSSSSSSKYDFGT